MTTQPEQFELESLNISDEKRAEILRLFPEIRTEGGKIDFDQLRRVLGEAVDAGKERYGMNWPGKADCFKTIQLPSVGTLLPCPDESVNFDTTENLIIEGDNLEVLKLLQKPYLGKVKMIYIDPPYNTGNDFIYPDNYDESLQTYLQYTGQVDAEGKKFGTNTDTDGRFHSKWMNMMYPRLYLARNLLREDGVIFINIDDNEFDNLRKLCNEIFGEENFLACISWKKADSPKMDADHFSTMHDYILVYAKIKEEVVVRRAQYTDETVPDHFDKEDEDGNRYYLKPLRAMGGQGETREARQSLYYGIEAPDGIVVFPKLQNGRDGAWRWSRNKLSKEKHRLEWLKNEDQWTPYYRILANEGSGRPPETILSHKDVGSNRTATAEMKRLFGDQKPFSAPKPSGLVAHLASFFSSEDDIVLDFFAGSGTTAHAVLDLNRQDDENRKFILVQLPEPLDPTKKEQKPGTDFCDSIGKPRTIAEITKERVRRVIKKLTDEDAGKFDLEGVKQQDIGFRVYKLAESNFKPWNADLPRNAGTLEQQLTLHIDHIREGRSAEDILYEILLKSGFPLTTPVETLTLAGLTVYSVADGTLLICLERELTLEAIRAMAEQKPERVVCLDVGFAGNDQLKTNAVQIFKTKGVTSFKTV